jgi:hypothetical protein
MLFNSQIIVNSIGKQIGKPIDLKNYIIILGAFPFYPLFYFYNRSYIKEVVSEFNKNG